MAGINYFKLTYKYMKETAANALIGYQAVSSRIIKARFKTKLGKMAIQIYAPLNDSSEDATDNFYGDLHSTVSDVPRYDMLAVIGDWNTKVGKDYGS